jgi:hypothetical protein
MNDKGRVALSSLAVSVSAGALLAVSGLVHADTPQNCAHSNCDLGFIEDYLFTPYFGYQPLEGGEGYHDWEFSGNCEYKPDDPEQCGCAGWANHRVYTQDLWTGELVQSPSPYVEWRFIPATPASNCYVED